MPTPQETHALAIDMLSQHGLIEQGWKVRWNRRHGVAGETVYSKKTITLSARAVAVYDWDTIVDGLLKHEVAHALVGPGHKHGPVWQKKVKALGGVTDKHCPTFSAGAAVSWENLGTVGLILAAVCFVIPPLGTVLVVAAAAFGVGTLVANARPVISEQEMRAIEFAVLNP